MAINLRIPSRAAANAIPSHLSTLSISWLNKQFKAVSIHRGLVEGTWENPSPIEGTSHFEGLLREAIQHTGYRGQTVTLVLGHQRLAQQLIDLPPVKGTPLRKLVERQAQQQKLFQGEPAWTFEAPVSTNKDIQRVILHLFPKILLSQLVHACRKNELYLRAVIPPSAILHHQMAQFPASREEIDLFAADTEGTTTVVIARSDGQLLLTRTLPGSWNEDVDRVSVDINRTLLFASQQYGTNIKKEIWVFGRGAKEHAPALQEKLQLLVKLSPVDDNPWYWPIEAAKLRPAEVPNFISAEQQKAPQRKVFARVVATGVFVMLIGALALSAYSFLEARQEEALVKKLSDQYARLQTRHAELQRRDYELTRKQEIATVIVDERPAPIPVWLLAYLSEAVPPDLVVTNLHVLRETEGWKIQIAGGVQQNLGSAATNRFNSVQLLRMRLAEGPFKLGTNSASFNNTNTNVVASSAASNAPGSSVLEWLARMQDTLHQSEQTNAGAPIETSFLIEGMMR